MACSYQGLALVTIFLGMFFMFKICVKGERDKYHFLILFLLHFFFSLFFVLEGERHKNLSKNTYLPLILTEVGYGKQTEHTTGGLSDTFQTTGRKSYFCPNHRWVMCNYPYTL